MKACKAPFMATLLVMFFYLFSTSSLFAQTASDTTKARSGARIQKTNWSNSMECTFGDTVCVYLWEDNILWLKLIVRFADPNIGLYLPMHFEYLFSNYTPSRPLFGYTDEVTPDIVEPTILENGDSAWMASFLFQFNLDEHCGSKNNFPFELTYRLVTLNGSAGYMPYPQSLYPTLFPPDTFMIDPTGVAPQITVIKEMCCYDQSYTCSPDPIHPYHRNIREVNRLNYSQVAELEDVEWEEESISIFPNPFSTAMTVRLMKEGQLDDTVLRVYDTHGRQVLQQNAFKTNETGELNITTEQWPSGIYFFHFSSEKDSKILKAIKY